MFDGAVRIWHTGCLWLDDGKQIFLITDIALEAKVKVKKNFLFLVSGKMNSYYELLIELHDSLLARGLLMMCRWQRMFRNNRI